MANEVDEKNFFLRNIGKQKPQRQGSTAHKNYI
jgi:hypothetical protein